MGDVSAYRFVDQQRPSNFEIGETVCYYSRGFGMIPTQVIGFGSWGKIHLQAKKDAELSRVRKLAWSEAAWAESLRRHVLDGRIVEFGDLVEFYCKRSKRWVRARVNKPFITSQRIGLTVKEYANFNNVRWPRFIKDEPAEKSKEEQADVIRSKLNEILEKQKKEKEEKRVEESSTRSSSLTKTVQIVEAVPVQNMKSEESSTRSPSIPKTVQVVEAAAPVEKVTDEDLTLSDIEAELALEQEPTLEQLEQANFPKQEKSQPEKPAQAVPKERRVPDTEKRRQQPSQEDARRRDQMERARALKMQKSQEVAKRRDQIERARALKEQKIREQQLKAAVDQDRKNEEERERKRKLKREQSEKRKEKELQKQKYVQGRIDELRERMRAAEQAKTTFEQKLKQQQDRKPVKRRKITHSEPKQADAQHESNQTSSEQNQPVIKVNPHSIQAVYPVPKKSTSQQELPQTSSEQPKAIDKKMKHFELLVDPDDLDLFIISIKAVKNASDGPIVKELQSDFGEWFKAAAQEDHVSHYINLSTDKPKPAMHVVYTKNDTQATE